MKAVYVVSTMYQGHMIKAEIFGTKSGAKKYLDKLNRTNNSQYSYTLEVLK